MEKPQFKVGDIIVEQPRTSQSWEITAVYKDGYEATFRNSETGIEIQGKIYDTFTMEHNSKPLTPLDKLL